MKDDYRVNGIRKQSQKVFIIGITASITGELLRFIGLLIRGRNGVSIAGASLSEVS